MKAPKKTCFTCGKEHWGKCNERPATVRPASRQVDQRNSGTGIRSAQSERVRAADEVPERGAADLRPDGLSSLDVYAAARVRNDAGKLRSVSDPEKPTDRRTYMRDLMRLKRAKEAIPKLEKRLAELEAYVKAKEMLE